MTTDLGVGGRRARDPRFFIVPALPLVIFCSFILGLATLAETPKSRENLQTCLSKAYRHEKAGWVDVHVEGGPRERGFQHGYLLGKEIAQSIQATSADWEYQTATKWDWLLGKSAAMFTRKIDNENLAELDGIVEGMQAAGVTTSRAEVIAYNAYFELSWYWWPLELKTIKDGKTKPGGQSCSAFIATGRATADGGVVLGHNTMFDYQLGFPNIIIDIVPEKGHRILMQTFPGWIHSGTDFFVTDAGLVGAETTIGGFEGFDPKEVAEFSRMRRATQDANSIEEWCAIMKRDNNGGYANAWLIGDVNSGDIARLELGLKHVAFEKKRDGFFVGSNVAEDLKILRFETARNETDIRLSSVARRVRLVSAHVGVLRQD
jgi:hypothetical protein